MVVSVQGYEAERRLKRRVWIVGQGSRGMEAGAREAGRACTVGCGGVRAGCHLGREVTWGDLKAKLRGCNFLSTHVSLKNPECGDLSRPTGSEASGQGEGICVFKNVPLGEGHEQAWDPGCVARR